MPLRPLNICAPLVQAEWVLAAAVVTHDLVSQWVEMPQHAWNMHVHAPMPIPRHPPITALDARNLGVDAGEILVEPNSTTPLFIGGLRTRAVPVRRLACWSLTMLVWWCYSEGLLLTCGTAPDSYDMYLLL